MALTTIQQVRLITQDNTPGLFIISDEEIQFFLERNDSNVNRASLDAARAILLNLSMRTDDTVDVLSIKSSKSAESYRLALQMFLRDPNLNPVLQNCRGYVSGVSLSDMQANDAISDNNIVGSPRDTPSNFPTSSGNYFDYKTGGY